MLFLLMRRLKWLYIFQTQYSTWRQLRPSPANRIRQSRHLQLNSSVGKCQIDGWAPHWGFPLCTHCPFAALSFTLLHFFTITQRYWEDNWEEERDIAIFSWGCSVRT